ncbi:ABC transporter substrate-binding protein [Gryllotalpicola protaetiae]|uniref:ABC transporter substrate-binding protein n=1 Tax=Gryllotalpicola protaetiae TaxID=2419771 RepID=A0A387BNP2_9MICO|nr:ABC transporter substrate-binding protein [Gryllotalpicola protaetiae]AYG03634.1 ABC transporter substrate-binding protein [Gryllotalpicola protaetiae]
MKRKFALVAPVAVTTLAVALTLTACSGGSASSSNNGSGSSQSGKTLETGGTFRLDLGTDPGSIFPYASTSGPNRQIDDFAYDSLVGRSKKGDAVPAVASSWKVTTDAVTYNIRKDVTCSDGTTLKPSDIAADFNYIKDPKTLSPWVQFSVPVKYTVSADDSAGTFTITSTTPFGTLLQGAGAVPLVCPQGLANPAAFAHASAGTGPFKITDYAQGDHYDLAVRPDYTWGPSGAKTSAAGTPKTVTINFVADESTMANQLISGEVNAAQITGPDRNRLDKTPGINRNDVPVIVGELNPNEAPGRILNDEQVRLAAAAALNPKDIAPVSTAQHGSTVDNMFAEQPVQCPANETKGNLPSYSPSKAKQLLEADGWTVGSDGIREKDGKTLTLKLIYQTGAPQTESAAELIGQELKAVGIGTNLVGETNDAWSQALYSTGDFDMFYSAINLEFPYMMSTFYGGATPQNGGRNSGDVVNADFNNLSAQAAAAPAEQACKLWNGAHEALLKRADVVPLSQGDRPFYTSKASLETVGLFAVPTSIRLYK